MQALLTVVNYSVCLATANSLLKPMSKLYKDHT